MRLTRAMLRSLTCCGGTLRDYLTDEGYEVDVALTGYDAVNMIAQHRADLVLLDITLPGMDGVEALRRIKALDATMPVVMMTGNLDEGLVQTTRELGALDYLMKPFELARPSDAVAVSLAYRGQSSEP